MKADDNLEALLEECLCNAYTKIIYNEEKILKNMMGISLSMKEYHTLDVVAELTRIGNNTISGIAQSLSITLSTCTINIDRLIEKGYLNKIKKSLDKRLSYIELTDKLFRHRWF